MFFPCKDPGWANLETLSFSGSSGSTLNPCWLRASFSSLNKAGLGGPWQMGSFLMRRGKKTQWRLDSFFISFFHVIKIDADTLKIQHRCRNDALENFISFSNMAILCTYVKFQGVHVFAYIFHVINAQVRVSSMWSPFPSILIEVGFHRVLQCPTQRVFPGLSPFSWEQGFANICLVHGHGDLSGVVIKAYHGSTWKKLPLPPYPQQAGFKKASFQEMDLNLKELGSGGVFETVLRQAVVVAAISAWTWVARQKSWLNMLESQQFKGGCFKWSSKS